MNELISKLLKLKTQQKVAVTVVALHAVGAEYDASKPVTLLGTVT